jgi:hypothetical protein
LFAGAGGDNINGPSLIVAPPWIKNPLGRFYLYFAHHKGDSIRLAYADRLEGPWALFQRGTLQLADAKGCFDHIASPDVHIDDKKNEIVMYFHGVVSSDRQMTFLARSKDGLEFETGREHVADFYFRAARWREHWIGMSKGGVLYVSDALTGTYRRLPQHAFPMRDPHANATGDVRHVALAVEGDDLHVYYSQIGDMPERIYRARVDLTRPRENWVAMHRETVLTPELPWEGRDLPLMRSKAGRADGPENALRDPAIFSHQDRTYLLYSGSGESNIGIVELTGRKDFLARLATWFELKVFGKSDA